jgi:hypothetical protein
MQPTSSTSASQRSVHGSEARASRVLRTGVLPCAGVAMSVEASGADPRWLARRDVTASCCQRQAVSSCDVRFFLAIALRRTPPQHQLQWGQGGPLEGGGNGDVPAAGSAAAVQPPRTGQGSAARPGPAFAADDRVESVAVPFEVRWASQQMCLERRSEANAASRLCARLSRRCSRTCGCIICKPSTQRCSRCQACVKGALASKSHRRRAAELQCSQLLRPPSRGPVPTTDRKANRQVRAMRDVCVLACEEGEGSGACGPLAHSGLAAPAARLRCGDGSCPCDPIPTRQADYNQYEKPTHGRGPEVTSVRPSLQTHHRQSSSRPPRPTTRVRQVGTGWAAANR